MREAIIAQWYFRIYFQGVEPKTLDCNFIDEDTCIEQISRVTKYTIETSAITIGERQCMSFKLIKQNPDKLKHFFFDKFTMGICKCRFWGHTKNDHEESTNHRVRNGDEQSSKFTQTSHNYHYQPSHLYNTSTSNLEKCKR